MEFKKKKVQNGSKEKKSWGYLIYILIEDQILFTLFTMQQHNMVVA